MLGLEQSLFDDAIQGNVDFMKRTFDFIEKQGFNTKVVLAYCQTKDDCLQKFNEWNLWRTEWSHHNNAWRNEWRQFMHFKHVACRTKRMANPKCS